MMSYFLYSVPTGPPLNIMAIPINSKSILLSWEAPRMDLQNGIIRAYNVRVLELETGQEQSFSLSGVDTFQIINSLHPFYDYNCSVAAFTIARGPIGFTVIRTPQEGNVHASAFIALLEIFTFFTPTLMGEVLIPGFFCCVLMIT